jgi:hypothetical protein
MVLLGQISAFARSDPLLRMQQIEVVPKRCRTVTNHRVVDESAASGGGGGFGSLSVAASCRPAAPHQAEVEPGARIPICSENYWLLHHGGYMSRCW